MNTRIGNTGKDEGIYQLIWSGLDSDSETRSEIFKSPSTDVFRSRWLQQQWFKLDWIRLQHFLISVNLSHDPTCKHCGTICRREPQSEKPHEECSIDKNNPQIQDAGPAAPPLGLTSGNGYQNAKQEITQEQLPILANYNQPYRDGAPSDPNDPFGDIEDPSKQCLDINCYEPVAWDDGQVQNSRPSKEDVFDTAFSIRRRCAGTGQRANVSPGARRFASRWTFSFPLSLWEKSGIFWSGELWGVQPCGVHRVHYRGDQPGSEGRPGYTKSYGYVENANF